MAKKKLENLSFEHAIEELETIVSALEKGELPLDESMALFERGLKLSQMSQHKLNDAEQKIQLLTAQQGKETLVDFELTETPNE